MNDLVGPAGAHRASGSTYSGRVGSSRCAANSCCLARAQGWYGTWPSGGSLTRLATRFAWLPSLALAPGAPSSPPCGRVKLLWLPIVLDQCPCTSGWPSASRRPVHSPDAIGTTVRSRQPAAPCAIVAAGAAVSIATINPRIRLCWSGWQRRFGPESADFSATLSPDAVNTGELSSNTLFRKDIL